MRSMVRRPFNFHPFSSSFYFPLVTTKFQVPTSIPTLFMLCSLVADTRAWTSWCPLLPGMNQSLGFRDCFLIYISTLLPCTYIPNCICTSCISYGMEDNLHVVMFRALIPLIPLCEEFQTFVPKRPAEVAIDRSGIDGTAHIVSSASTTHTSWCFVHTACNSYPKPLRDTTRYHINTGQRRRSC